MICAFLLPLLYDTTPNIVICVFFITGRWCSTLPLGMHSSEMMAFTYEVSNRKMSATEPLPKRHKANGAGQALCD